jgi:hypothetical protein
VIELSNFTGQEVSDPHTTLLRLGLAEPESREYWSHCTPGSSLSETTQRAFEERWFGSRPMGRVQYLVKHFKDRFQAFPNSLKALQHWNPLELSDRKIICHWHLQLSDPIYRQVFASHLQERWLHPQPTLDRNALVRWVGQQVGPEWAQSTVQRMAAGISSCLQEAGFVEKGPALRPLNRPRVSDQALAYLLYLLRETRHTGHQLDNPYLASLDLIGPQLELRLARLPGIGFQKMANLRELTYQHANLWEWARAEL